MGWVGGWWRGGSWSGWVGSGAVDLHDTPMLFFGNLVKKPDNYHCKPTSNIDIYPSILKYVLIIC